MNKDSEEVFNFDNCSIVAFKQEIRKPLFQTNVNENK